MNVQDIQEVVHWPARDLMPEGERRVPRAYQYVDYGCSAGSRRAIKAAE